MLSSKRKRLGANKRKEIIPWYSAKHFDHTQSEEQITEIQSEGALLHRVSALPVTSIVAQRRRTTCDRARQARSNF